MKKRIALSGLILIFVAATSIVGCQRQTEPATAANAQQKVTETTLADAIKTHGWGGLNELATRGERGAQFFVGVAYLTGEGIPKNFAEARKWIRKSANQGMPSAQNIMGDITQDDIRTARLSDVTSLFGNAYMWFSLAAAQGHEAAKESLVHLESNPTAGTARAIAKGQALASEWRPCYSANCWDYEPSVETETYSLHR